MVFNQNGGAGGSGSAITNPCYLRNKERGYLGNSPLWWAKGGAGYTDNLDNAERFDEKQAIEKVRENPDKWEAWRCIAIDAWAYRTFDSQNFNAARGLGGAVRVLKVAK